MQTHFSEAQLADPDTRESAGILRACVHCGFCTATCPTYLLLGDELDSPRGRIQLIQGMLEQERPAGEREVRHLDRCLSCLSCMTTCPSGVNYMHLIDHARAYVERTYVRPWPDRMLRALLAALLPYPGRFRLALLGGWLAKPFAPLLPRRLAAMVRMAPARLRAPSSDERPQVFAAQGMRRKRVALLAGCAQPVLSPEINAAAIRLLTRHGCEVAIAEGTGCCGALTHHLGKDEAALPLARANIDAWSREIERHGLDAIVIAASGCGTMVKDYGHLFRADPAYAGKAARIAALTVDISELMAELGLARPAAAMDMTVAYHSACSLQHGQQVRGEPVALLRAAGFTVKEVPEGHICCGSAGTYNLLQPEIAGQLQARKVANIESLRPDAIAAGNIGCIAQIAAGTDIPILHTVELLDWATGGPKPACLA